MAFEAVVSETPARRATSVKVEGRPRVMGGILPAGLVPPEDGRGSAGLPSALLCGMRTVLSLLRRCLRRAMPAKERGRAAGQHPAALPMSLPSAQVERRRKRRTVTGRDRQLVVTLCGGRLPAVDELPVGRVVAE